MSFPLEYCREFGSSGHLTKSLTVDCDIPLIREELGWLLDMAPDGAPAYRHAAFHHDIPAAIRQKTREMFGASLPPIEEGYVLLADDGIDVYAPTARGLFHGWQTIKRHCTNGVLPRMLAYEAPVCPVRGVKLLLPSAVKLDDFKRFIDLLGYYKYNTVMLEVGGAMEYRRRPEINAAWLRYCREMNEYPGKTHKIQGGCGWSKNSIHSSNGGGGVLSQAVVRELADYCRARFMTVIPEVPSLSHSDYLLLAHPELKERAEDSYPDTYCPSHPETYRLLFDVLDEVIEVFTPEVINIGHDEWYSIALCDRCRGRDPADLYADDVRKIHDHLAARRVRTLLWGEKLLDAHCLDGEPIGGAKKPGMPATHQAIERVPRDLEILHWYWGIDRSFEREYLRRGLPVIFGNFAGSVMPEWRRRIGQDGVRGAIISNWGETDRLTLQRNGILFEVVYTAMLFWDRRCDETCFDELRLRTFEDLQLYRRRTELAESGRTRISLVHTTDLRKEYVAFVDGQYINPQADLLGHWIIHYADGTTHAEPIIYGQNIAAQEMEWGQAMHRRYDVYDANYSLMEVACSTRPRRFGARTWYEFEFTNPQPDKPVVGVELRRQESVSAGIFLHSFSVQDTP